ncbi:hypothetical protein M0R45_018065 [Rubus argutus]|uniref:Uncharacterized protein n=1 Tax=Rubus argutus TaxID=59490 RepID=A0AAW1XXS7_RUBAR
MDCRPLEIRLFSANDIKDINLLSKMDVYAVVSISSGLRSRSSGPRSTRTATPTPNGTTVGPPQTQDQSHLRPHPRRHEDR